MQKDDVPFDVGFIVVRGAVRFVCTHLGTDAGWSGGDQEPTFLEHRFWKLCKYRICYIHVQNWQWQCSCSPFFRAGRTDPLQAGSLHVRVRRDANEQVSTNTFLRAPHKNKITETISKVGNAAKQIN